MAGIDSKLLPPLSMVRAFEAAARLSSFTRAAEELHMTQAAVSYQIKQLERRLGLTLFQRLPRQVALTAAGQRLAPAVVDAFRTLRTAFGQTLERDEHALAITSLPTIAATWLVPRLGAFQLAQPRLAVRLDTSVPTVDFSDGEFDVGIRSGRGDWPGLLAHRLLPSLFTPLCSPQVRDRLRAPSDLLRLQRMGRERWWRQWFDATGVHADLAARPSIELGVEQFEVTAAIAGHGVSITSPLFFRRQLASGELVRPFDPVLRDERDYWLVYPAARRHSPKIQAFRDWLLEEARREPDAEREYTVAAERATPD